MRTRIGHEAGWKDTAVMMPGQVTRVIAQFDREGRYVWHCHILSHEDHEMMRPYYIGPMPVASEEMVEKPVTEVSLDQNVPNPFNPSTQISFSLVEESEIDLAIYNVAGQRVRTLAQSVYPGGRHAIAWDGRDASGNKVSSGVYFYKLTAGDRTFTKKMLIVK